MYGKTIRPEVIVMMLQRHALFENGDIYIRHVAGNFDGQVMSLGTLNFAGYSCLIPLIWSYLSKYPDSARRDLNKDGYDLYQEVLNEIYIDPIGLFHRINKYPYQQRLDNVIIEPWHSAWERAAMSWEWQDCEKPYIQDFIDQAEYIINWFNDNSVNGGDSIITDKGLDLAFDIACQSWSPTYYKLAETDSKSKMYAILNATVNALIEDTWKQNVIDRKTVIIEGEGLIHTWRDNYGVVHGTYWKGNYDNKPMYKEDYDLNAKFEDEVIIPIPKPIEPEIIPIPIPIPEPEIIQPEIIQPEPKPKQEQEQFTDLDINSWSYKHFIKAKEIGLINGRLDEKGQLVSGMNDKIKVSEDGTISNVMPFDRALVLNLRVYNMLDERIGVLEEKIRIMEDILNR